MTILARTRLSIRDQGELLNQIAGTYKDFFRAAMEYIDNSVDAATALNRGGHKDRCELAITINTVSKSVSFVDNCDGMSPDDLSQLLSEVGRSKKKMVPWANGQFGFGVHAFRAFAKEATFVSRKSTGPEAFVRIDRSFDETREVRVETTKSRVLKSPGTEVTISRFDRYVFKRGAFFRSLVSEIEHHFDDVLRCDLIRITVREDKSRPYECRSFDYESLPGTPIKREAQVAARGRSITVAVDLKVLERVQENRLAVLTNKQRRVQTIADLKSFKNYLRQEAMTSYVWSNPFVAGAIEINDLCSPNLTRDDLRDSAEREALYNVLIQVQREVETAVATSMNRKVQDSYRQLAETMSATLARLLKGFRLQFERVVASGDGDGHPATVGDEGEELPFGGEGPGGGGPGPSDDEGGGDGLGQGGPGDAPSGGGPGPGRREERSGQSAGQVGEGGGPRIEFQAHAGEDRVIDLGGSLIINTMHADFTTRNPSRGGQIRLDARLLNYVAVVVAPSCVHRLFVRRGRVPTALEAGANVVELSLALERDLSATVLGMEMGPSEPTRE